MIALLDLWGRYGWWCCGTAGLMALEAYAYWRQMRNWPPEARIFAFALGCGSCLLMAAGWAVGVAGTWTLADGVAFVFGLFAAGGLGTAPVFLHLTIEDHYPQWWLLRRARKGRPNGRPS